MAQSELQKLNMHELIKQLGEKREEVRGMRFGAAGSGVRNTHALGNAKKEIARILTEISSRTKKGSENA